MLNPDQQRLVLKAVKDSPKPLTTMAVWNAAISFIAYDRDGEIMASRQQIADAAGVLPRDVSTALAQLVTIGALLRLKPGRYAINPHVGWSGSLIKRDMAAKKTPRLVVVPKSSDSEDASVGTDGHVP
jgi:hypothetical protein